MSISILSLIKLSCSSLLGNPVRSFLSGIGVFMGVFAVSATLQVGNISRAVIKQQLAERDAPQVFVFGGFNSITIWMDTEPSGHWWDLTKPMVKLEFVEPPVEIFGKPITQQAHKSDVIRLQVLLDEGGIYADMLTPCHHLFLSF